jgi:hypothetical protein
MFCACPAFPRVFFYYSSSTSTMATGSDRRSCDLFGIPLGVCMHAYLKTEPWCKFPFTQWSVHIILSKEPVFKFFHTLELYSVRCKKCKHTRQKKITIFRGLVQSIFTHVNNGITVGMWGKTHCFDVQCKMSRNSMHLSHSVNLVDSQLQPELGYKV